jgi:flavin-dependent dehydrogenase
LAKTAYDLVVVGAGPAGFTAAKTAAENGLRVALLERKKEITTVTRACSMMMVLLQGKYLSERVILNTEGKRLCFPHYGFSVRYDGPHQDFYTWTIFSPRGNKIQLGDYEENSRKGEQGRASAIYCKETLLSNFLDDVSSLGVDVFNSCNVIGVRKENGQVKVFSREGRVFEGTFVIAADGRQSRVAKTLGFNESRTFFGTNTTMGYEMVGVEPPDKFAFYQIFLGLEPPTRGWLSPRARKDEYFVMVTCQTPGTNYVEAFKKFTTEGPFASWFRRAEVKRCLGAVGNMVSDIKDPYKDQVLLVGDVIWCMEAEMTGAVMSGWKAANAVAYALTEGEISRKGVSGYLDWWRDEVSGRYDYRDMIRNAVLPYVLGPDEIDFLFSLLKKPLPSIFDPYETPKVVGAAIAEVIPVIARERPAIAQKMARMPSVPLEKIFEGCVRVGFPSRTLF